MKSDIINTANSESKVSYNSIKEINIIKINENRSIIIVDINEVRASDKPVYINNNIKNSYVRLGDSNQKMNDDLLKAIIIDSNENLDSKLLPETFTIDDINLETVKRYMNFINEDISTYSKNYEEFLLQIGAFRKDREDNNKIKLTKGCLLFFGKFISITDLLPHFQLDYFQIDRNSENRWEDRVSTGDMDYPELNIFDFYLIVYEKICNSIKDKFILDKKVNQRLPYKKNLQESVREALVNSLMHAHYDINIPIKINSHNEYIEFLNPGILKITIEDFFNGGTSRVVNDVIATLFRRVGISEKAGTGGKRIYDVSGKLNLKEPEIFITENGCTKLRIWKEDLLSTLNGSDNELKIMEYMIEKMIASKNEISTDLNISDYYTRISLTNLVSEKHLKKVGNGRSTKYMLSTNNPRGKVGVIRGLIKFLDNQ